MLFDTNYVIYQLNVWSIILAMAEIRLTSL